LSIAKPQAAGLFDILSAGYSQVHQRLWVISIPLALNIYMWYGRPFVLRTADYQAVRGWFAALAGVQHGEVAGGWFLQNLLAEDLRLMLARLNLIPVLWPAASPDSSGVFEIGFDHPWLVLGSIMVINVPTLLLSSLFLILLNGAPLRQAPGLSLLRDSLRAAWYIFCLIAIAIGIGTVLAVPFVAISAIVIASMPATALPIVLIWHVSVLWMAIYLSFGPEAIVVGKIGPIRAIYNSISIVRRNLISTFVFLGIILLIGHGLNLAWIRLTDIAPWSTALALIGSAYISSGLCAARLEFYRDRLTRWRSTHSPAS
jgi:hypothetical protein